ncbi:hypothetical protein [Micromonospora fluostatini]|uniref:hypothetical protein n=1 Tax=Micromonospora sp. JCM 30529 TaxID=3421643 RepID=UPI003D16782D
MGRHPADQDRRLAGHHQPHQRRGLQRGQHEGHGQHHERRQAREQGQQPVHPGIVARGTGGRWRIRPVTSLPRRGGRWWRGR